MKAVLITSGQPSLNPRLVKEADALSDAGWSVTVLYQYWNEWGTQLDATLLPGKQWKAIRVGGAPRNGKLIYWVTRLLFKYIRILANSKLFFSYLAELSLSRCSLLLYRNALKYKADLYIGHNLGALPAVCKAAQYHHARCGFDAEDLHRQEVTDEQNSIDFKIKKYTEDKYFKKLDYITTASPLISEQYKKEYPALTFHTILNVFPAIPIAPPATKNPQPLKLFWFSQTIGRNRGLEEVFVALARLNTIPIELHLLGNMGQVDKAFFEIFATENNLKADQIYYHSPIPSEEIISFASRFDAGLATETGLPLNRDICLTNKIFTYIQAGLAVIASNTSAQKALLNTYPDMGFIYAKGDSLDLSNIIELYNKDKNLLLQHRINAFQYGMKQLNWNSEQVKFLKIIEDTVCRK